MCRLYSGVCHTDYSFCTNAWNSQAPVPRGQIGGHEGIGHVVAVGPGVTHPAIGFNVGVNYVASACLSCSMSNDLQPKSLFTLSLLFVALLANN
jgi:D-arabinose 1-dehydrogenase-like Zn-dependent alcohol dehydrogenase